jgi:2-desacetyl-2-hydroxyethyl bacteriochlorophyllide A dehydrogenase
MTDQMVAAVFEGEGRLTLKEVDVPQVRAPDDVLLAVRAVGICGTDVHILSVPPGHPASPGVILGHEYTAEILQTGERVNHVGPADRVVIDPSVWCGSCAYCQRGLTNLCDRMEGIGVFRHGGFAGFSVVPARAVYKIASRVAPEIAALAEPLADVISGVRKLQPTPGESALVLGAGPIGLLYTLLLRAAGTQPLIVAEISEYRSAQARACGADLVINPRNEDLAAAVRRTTGLGADMAVDAAGSLLEESVRAVRKGGRIVLFGMNEHARPVLKQYDITKHEHQILGSYIARGTFPQAVSLLESASIDFGRLITHRLPLREIHRGIELLRQGQALKIAVMP